MNKSNSHAGANRVGGANKVGGANRVSSANSFPGVDIRHLKMVLKVASAGSLTAAAKLLFLSQSALSHQLKLLETAVGCELFARQGKKMVLTPAGARLHRGAEAILLELDNTRLDLQQLVSGEAGRIRLSTACNTSYSWLPAVVSAFQKTYPNIEIVIESFAAGEVEGALVRGDIDLGILNMPKRDYRKSQWGLFEDDLVVLVAKDDPLAAYKSATPKRLDQQNFIFYKGVEERLTRLVFAGSDYGPASVASFQLSEAIFEWIAAGLGIGVMSYWSAKAYIDSGKVVAIKIPNAMANRVWYAKFSSEKPLAYVEHFVALMQKGIPEGAVALG